MSIPSVGKDTPPFVRFDYMEYGIDLEQSKTSSAPIPKVVPFAFIMQKGGKDCHEAVAEEWLETKRQQAMAGQYPSEWYNHHKLQFDEFLKGEELPRNGIPIKTWPAPTREQVLRLQALGITTVEDLADVPDSGLQNIGLDGRNLRDLAKNYLAESRGAGALAKQLADLQESDRQKSATIERMSAAIAALEAQAGRQTLKAKG